MKDRMFKMLTPCSDWAEKLAAYPDGLSSSGRDALDEHVASCSACSAVLRLYDEMGNFIHNLSSSDAPTELPPKLLELWKSQDSRDSTNEEISPEKGGQPENDGSKKEGLLIGVYDKW